MKPTIILIALMCSMSAAFGQNSENNKLIKLHGNKTKVTIYSKGKITAVVDTSGNWIISDTIATLKTLLKEQRRSDSLLYKVMKYGVKPEKTESFGIGGYYNQVSLPKKISISNSTYCPEYKIGEPIYSDWVNTSIGSNKPVNPKWVYDDERPIIPVYSNLVYCPCGCKETLYATQKRVDKVSGTIQQRKITYNWMLIDKPKTAYEAVIDSLNKVKP